MRWRKLLLVVTSIVLTVGIWPAGRVEAASGPTRAVMADPDTIAAVGSNAYVTFATERTFGGECFLAPVNYRVPYIISGSDDNVSLTNQCPDGDALANGPGAWADASEDIWAPSVVHYDGYYIMYYTATKAGTATASPYTFGHRCIGRAYSETASGPYVGMREFACGPNGKWAIDPDAFVGADGALYVVYRDDYQSPHNETALSIVKTQRDPATGRWGMGDFDTRSTLLDSRDVDWDDIGSGTATIENPSMLRMGNGNYWLVFSGNDFGEGSYSTGLADCGASPGGGCTVKGGRSVPYWGSTGDAVPQHHTLPFNLLGPGGASLFRGRDGGVKMVWAGHNPIPNRKAAVGNVDYNAGVFVVE